MLHHSCYRRFLSQAARKTFRLITHDPWGSPDTGQPGIRCPELLANHSNWNFFSQENSMRQYCKGRSRSQGKFVPAFEDLCPCQLLASLGFRYLGLRWSITQGCHPSHRGHEIVGQMWRFWVSNGAWRASETPHPFSNSPGKLAQILSL